MEKPKDTRKDELGHCEIRPCVDPPLGLSPEVKLDKSFDAFTVGDLRKVVG